VVPIVENYWGKPGVFGKAIELAWDFALGKTRADDDVAAVAAGCEAAIGELYEDDETGSTMRAASSIANALEASREDDSEKALDAALEAQSAAEIDDREHAQDFGMEEAEWQGRALEIASSVGAPSRESFASISGEPQWLKTYRREQWIKRP
jgi:hypothetical protein